MRYIIISDISTADMLSTNFKEKIKDIASDEAFVFINWIKGTSTYGERFFYDVLIIRQLSFPRFFMRFSFANLLWNRLISIKSKLMNFNLNEKDIEKIPFHDKCKILNNNLVLVAKDFQYHAEGFSKEII